VPSAKAADLRRFLPRHAKSNQIDAETLARLPLVDPAGLQPLELPSGPRASLDRRVRTCQWLTEQATSYKIRIRDLARQLIPTLNDVLTGELRIGDLAVLERYGDPRALLAAGPGRIATLLHAGSRGSFSVAKAQARARRWVGVAEAAVALYGDDPAMPYADVAAELASQIRLLRGVLAEQKPHEQARERAYRRVEPDELARSLPGIAEVGAPLLVAAMGRPQRFTTAAQFKAFTGLTPRASETGETDRKGQAITKAGAARVRKQLLCSANTTRQVDPQLAAVYHAQMVERGAHHIKALCVVAAKLAERLWLVETRGQPYVIRDLDGRPVTIGQAKQIIASCYSVSEEVRRRRRSSKPTRATRTGAAGKALQQVPTGHAHDGACRAASRPPSPSRSSTAPLTPSTREASPAPQRRRPVSCHHRRRRVGRGPAGGRRAEQHAGKTRLTVLASSWPEDFYDTSDPMLGHRCRQSGSRRCPGRGSKSPPSSPVASTPAASPACGSIQRSG
jgi:transposase